VGGIIGDQVGRTDGLPKNVMELLGLRFVEVMASITGLYGPG